MPIHEAPIAFLASAEHPFRGAQPELVVASVLAGNTAAQLWVADGPDDLALLWDKGNNVFYLAGQQAAAARDDLAHFIGGELRERASAAGRARFKVRALAPAIEAALPMLFAGMELHPYPEHLLCYARAQPPDAPAPTLEPLRWAAVDRALLDRSAEIRDEVAWMWPSLAQFDQHGFGCAALHDEQIVCWCTAEYVGPTHCGIGIATLPAYERRGLATATAARFVAECLRRGLTPYWECAAANAPSLRVAHKLGFAPIDTPLFWLGMFAA